MRTDSWIEHNESVLWICCYGDRSALRHQKQRTQKPVFAQFPIKFRWNSNENNNKKNRNDDNKCNNNKWNRRKLWQRCGLEPAYRQRHLWTAAIINAAGRWGDSPLFPNFFPHLLKIQKKERKNGMNQERRVGGRVGGGRGRGGMAVGVCIVSRSHDFHLCVCLCVLTRNFSQSRASCYAPRLRVDNPHLL